MEQITDREYAYFKRCLDDYTVDPSSQRELEADGSKAHILEAIEYITFGIGDEALRQSNAYVRKYLEVYQTITGYVHASNHEKRYADISLAYYEQCVRNRCRMEYGPFRKHPNIYYYPICFELSEGCKVQCSFCGLNAKPYCSSFSYNEENAALFRSIMLASRSVIGEVVDVAPLYLATEPMDNADYEQFLAISRELFGTIPQTTTAVADVYPQRVRAIAALAGEEGIRNQAAIRISIRTLEQYHRIRSLYTPEELMYIELLANNPESVNRISDSGRAKNSARIAKGKRSGYSICCIAGARVNLATKTIEYIEPCLPDDTHPEGIISRKKLFFTDASDYEDKLRQLYAEFAFCKAPSHRVLRINPAVRVARNGDYIVFQGDGISYKLPANTKDEEIVKKLMNKCCAEDILDDRLEEKSQVLQVLDELYMRGYIML